MNKKGFTLIELLVVVLIIGILSSVALPQYTKAVEKSRMTEAWSTLKTINDALAIRNMEMGTTNQKYPFDELSISFTDKNGNAPTNYSFESKNFTYRIVDYVNRPAAIRNSSNDSYVLSIVGGKRGCHSLTGSCKKYGFTRTSSSCLTGGASWDNTYCFTDQ